MVQKSLAYGKDSVKVNVIIITTIIVIMITNLTPTPKSYLKLRLIFGFFRTFQEVNYSPINITDVYENTSWLCCLRNGMCYICKCVSVGARGGDKVTQNFSGAYGDF